MKALFGARWILVILALIFFSLVIWFGGPYVAVNNYAPLGSEGARTIAIVVLVVFWGLRALLREFKAVLATRNLAQAVVKQEDPTDARASADAKQMQERFNEATETLQKSTKGRKSLYDLPWYVIIGPPGAGKTTIINNSGLNFPLSEKFGKAALRGVGGTRNCDWWFTDQAILLDTAGRYTTQDSDQSSDSAGWLGFLGLLRKYRKRRPINGVFVAISVVDLATQSESDRMRHVEAVRARLQELNRELKISLPVYLLLTKCDLLAGFNEFFDDLHQDGRAQVWGATFALEASRSGEAAKHFQEEFALLLDRLNTRVLARMESERDVQRRALIFGFPREVAGTRRALGEFVTQAFGESARERGVWLRGVYFTSGTQEGTPVDRMLGSLARTFGLGMRAISSQSGRGKAFFIQRLLLDVVFQESGLAGVNRSTEVRRILTQAALFVGIAVLTILGILALALSYQRNRAYLTQVQAAVEPLQNLPPASPQALAAELPRLDAYHDVMVVANQHQGEVPLSMRSGLYQGGSLGGAAQDAYLRELNTALMPAVASMLRTRITKLATEPDKLYEYLKIYLMLGSPERLVPAEMQFVTDQEWRQRYKADPSIIERLQIHVASLLQDKSRVEPQNLDTDIVERARVSLRQASLPVLIYSRLKLNYANDTEHALHLDQELGLAGDRVLVRRNGAPLTEPVPSLYTRPVFMKIARTGKLEVARDFLADGWVLGEGVSSGADIPRLSADMMRIYEDDYIKVWDNVLADVVVRPSNGTRDLSEVMAALAGPTSPLKSLLTVVDANTNMEKAPPDPADKVAAGATAAIAAKLAPLQQMLGNSTPAVEKPGVRITKHFETVNKLIDGPPGSAPIDRALGAVSQVQQQVSKIGGGLGDTSALDSVSSPGQVSAMEQLSQIARGLPAPVSGIVSAVGTKGETVAKTEAGAELSRRYQTEVAAECQQLISGRYPFTARAANDVALQDFARMFGPAGVFDTFFRQRLAPLVDTSTNPWRWKEGATGIAGSAALLPQFQAADRIRQMYFPPGAQLPTLHFSLTPTGLDGAVPRLAIEIDGQLLEYRHGPQRTQALAWPGPSPGQASVLFEEGGGAGPNRSYLGPWALFHLLDEATVTPQSDVRYQVGLSAGGHSARLLLEAASVRNPFSRNELRAFHCSV